MAEGDHLAVGVVEHLEEVGSTVDSIVVDIRLAVLTVVDTEVEAEDTPLTRRVMECFHLLCVDSTGLVACLFNLIDFTFSIGFQ